MRKNEKALLGERGQCFWTECIVERVEYASLSDGIPSPSRFLTFSPSPSCRQLISKFSINRFVTKNMKNSLAISEVLLYNGLV